MKIFNIIFIILFLASCQKKESGPTIQDYNWLVGTWYAHGLDYFEEWKFNSDTSLFGRAYTVEGQDTSIKETIDLVYTKKHFEYIPHSKKRTDGKPLTFTSTSFSKNQIEFENMQNSFPNRIIYFKHSDKQVDVRIEEVNGTEIGQTYDIIMTIPQ